MEGNLWPLPTGELIRTGGNLLSQALGLYTGHEHNELGQLSVSRDNVKKTTLGNSSDSLNKRSLQ